MATNAISLNGSTQYGTVPNYTDFDNLTGTFTIEGWFYNSSSSAAFSVAWSVDKNSTTNNYARFQTEAGTGSSGINFGVDYATIDADGFVGSPGPFTTDTWVYMAFVATLNAQTKIYKGVEGTAPTEISYTLRNTPSGAISSPSGMGLSIGRDGTSDGGDPNWTGNVGGFLRVWDHARSLTQLQYNYQTHVKTARSAGLIMNLKFEEGTGTTIANESNASASASLTGSPSWTTGPTIYYPSLIKSIGIRPRAFAPGIAR